MKFSLRAKAPQTFFGRKGMTLLELLIVISIIGLLAALLIPTMGKMIEIATAQKLTSHLGQISTATTAFAAENGGRLPSPEYPGGMTVPNGVSEEEYFPHIGMWLDGPIFTSLYPSNSSDETKPLGYHLRGTIFENTQSIKQDPLETNWYRHSYAMNANLQYDRLYDNIESSNPYLTEKTLSNLLFAPNAMLFIECTEPNVVMQTDREAIVQTIEEHWGRGGKAITAYLDGHAERLVANEIPSADPENDRDSSRFWRGVDPDR